MNCRSMCYKTLCRGAFAALVAAIWALPAYAEAAAWSCSYTEVTYNAPFMEEQSRECPQGRCNYAISYDVQNGQGQVNGVSGYELESKGDRVTLYRSRPNPIVGGTDSARLIIDTASGEFVSIKQTPPDVTLTARGQCLPEQ